MLTKLNVTRLEVIDHRADDEFRQARGRVFTIRNVPMTLEFSLQDGNRTLKIFITDKK